MQLRALTKKTPTRLEQTLQGQLCKSDRLEKQLNEQREIWLTTFLFYSRTVSFSKVVLFFNSEPEEFETELPNFRPEHLTRLTSGNSNIEWRTTEHPERPNTMSFGNFLWLMRLRLVDIDFLPLKNHHFVCR